MRVRPPHLENILSAFVGLPEPEEIESILTSQAGITAGEPTCKLSVVRDASAYAVIIQTVENEYLRWNGQKCVWSPLALRMLKELLDRRPGIPPGRWKGAVLKRYAGPRAARQAPPVNFIPKLHLYLQV